MSSRDTPSLPDAPCPPYRLIVVPIDGTLPADPALEEAAAIARACGAKVRVVHVFDPFQLVNGFESSGELARHVLPRAREQASRMLASAVERLHASGVAAECRLVERVASEVGADVALEAQACAADLIVASTHGRRGLDRLCMGSHAEQIVRNSRAPVLLVRRSALED